MTYVLLFFFLQQKVLISDCKYNFLNLFILYQQTTNIKIKQILTTCTCICTCACTGMVRTKQMECCGFLLSQVFAGLVLRLFCMYSRECFCIALPNRTVPPIPKILVSLCLHCILLIKGTHCLGSVALVFEKHL